MAQVEAIVVSGIELLRVIRARFSNKITLEIISAEKHGEQNRNVNGLQQDRCLLQLPRQISVLLAVVSKSNTAI